MKLTTIKYKKCTAKYQLIHSAWFYLPTVYDDPHTGFKLGLPGGIPVGKGRIWLPSANMRLVYGLRCKLYKPAKDVLVVSAEKGFSWDGPSGLTFDTDSSMAAALVHDIIYRCIRHSSMPPARRKQVRAYADAALYDLCVRNGMYKTRAKIWWRAVSAFGADSAYERPEVESFTSYDYDTIPK